MTAHDRYSDIAERFRKDTAGHEMTVLHDDGLYRHLRFKAPERGSYWFDIVTWPDILAIRGDIDGYMFTRVTDMFEFFRMHRTPRDGRLESYPHYWSEKVEGRRDITKSYSQALFREHVSSSTTGRCVRAVLAKLGARTRAHAVAIAHRQANAWIEAERNRLAEQLDHAQARIAEQDGETRG